MGSRTAIIRRNTACLKAKRRHRRRAAGADFAYGETLNYKQADAEERERCRERI